MKNSQNSTEADDRELESKVMILPKSCESTLQRDKKAEMVEFKISGYPKPYYLDTGVGLGFQYAGLMNILRSHLDKRLQISSQILNEGGGVHAGAAGDGLFLREAGDVDVG